MDGPLSSAGNRDPSLILPASRRGISSRTRHPRWAGCGPPYGSTCWPRWDKLQASIRPSKQACASAVRKAAAWTYPARTSSSAKPRACWNRADLASCFPPGGRAGLAGSRCKSERKSRARKCKAAADLDWSRWSSSTGSWPWRRRRSSRAELTALAQVKSPLVKLRGQWVEVNSAEIHAALEFLEEMGADRQRCGTLSACRLALAPAGMPLEIAGVDCLGLDRRSAGAARGTVPFEELPPPAGLRGTLRPYQLRGYSWLPFLRQWGLGRVPGRRHGTGQDDPDAGADPARARRRRAASGAAGLPDVGGRQLAEGGGAVHAGAAGAGASRRRHGTKARRSSARRRGTPSCFPATRCCIATSSVLREGALGAA